MPASPPSTSLATSEARDNFAELVNRAAFGKERLLLTRRGKPLVALVPVEDLEALEALEDQRDSAEVRARLEEWRQDPVTIPLAEVARQPAAARRKPRG